MTVLTLFFFIILLFQAEEMLTSKHYAITSLLERKKTLSCIHQKRYLYLQHISVIEKLNQFIRGLTPLIPLYPSLSGVRSQIQWLQNLEHHRWRGSHLLQKLHSCSLSQLATMSSITPYLTQGVTLKRNIDGTAAANFQTLQSIVSSGMGDTQIKITVYQNQWSSRVVSPWTPLFSSSP